MPSYPAGMSFNSENGILAQISGDFIAKGGNSLPPAGSDQPQTLTAEVEVPHLGRVRITYELMSSRHGKSRNWFWTGCYAEVAS